MMTTKLTVVCSILCALAQAADTNVKSALTFFVATNGNDSWSGRLAEPNGERTDGPFASIERARDAIRQIKASAGLQRPIRVLVRGGTYHLNASLRITPDDSGTAESPITYAAYPGNLPAPRASRQAGKPVLSGGRVLTGWKRHKGKIRSCSLKALGLGGLRFRQLFYRGDRQIMARWPNRDPKRPRTGGFLYCGVPPEVGSKREFRYPRGAFPRTWARPTEVEVVIFPQHGWHNPKVPIANLDRARRFIRLSSPVNPIKHGNRFYVQNALEELDAPGEWYLDRRADTVYFWPPDDDLEKAGAVVPALRNVVSVEGDLGGKRFVEHVTFSHLGLECCDGHGVVLSAARHCGVIGCTVLKVGGTGVVIDAGSSHCRVAGNDILYPGAHAIAMYYNVGTPKSCTDNVITNNYAHHCGEITICSFGWGSGICISGHRNVVSHNLIHDTAYSALCFDGYDHVIEYNHVHHANLECKDGDGIYGWVNTRGGSGRNTVRFNRVHDVVGYCMVRPGVWRSPYYSLGMRADDYLSNTTFYGNLVYRASFACVCLHGGWNNTVENNVLVDGGQGQVRLPNMLRDRPSLSGLTGRHAGAPGDGKWAMSGNIVRRNIMCYSSPESAAYQCVVGWEDRILSEANGNLIWHGGRTPRVSIQGWPAENSWRRWVAGGRDTRSLIADPLFVDPENDDYRLRPESPAFKLGFKALPVEQIGLVKSPERASWPVVEPEVYRDPPPPTPPPPPPPGMPIGRAYLTVKPVAIDGRLEKGDDDSRALLVARLQDGSGVSSRGSEAHVLRDDANLYVGVVNDTTAVSVEIDLQPRSQSANVKALTLRGYPSGKSEHPSGAGIAYAARTHDGQWVGEWRIPFRAVAFDPGATADMRFNIRVHQRDGRQPIVWADRRSKGLLAFLPSVRADAENLLVNGDFEKGGQQPAGWVVSDRVTGALPKGALKPKCLWATEGRNGSRCLKLEATDRHAMRVCECWWHQMIDAPPAGTYVMTYDIRARNIRARGERARFYACGWARMKEGIQPAGINLGYTPENRIERGSAPFWTRRECILDVPRDVQTLHVIFGIKHATGSVWIDNVRLEKCGDE